jgi:hypothetical protein
MPQPWPLLTVDAGFATATPGLGGTELLLDDPARGLLDTATLGTVTDWTPLGGYIGDTPIIQSVTITRPSTRQQGPLVTYDAGTCTVTLANSDGRFSPENLAGPYVTAGVSQIRPMVPLRVRATWASVTWTLFSGYVRSWIPPTAQNGPDYDYTVAAAQDPFCILEGVTLPAAGAAGAGELSGARVRRILAAAGWYDGAQGGSVLDAGQSAVQAATFGDTALNLLRTTAQSEIGDLYCDGAGRVVFRDRDAPLTATRSNTVQGVFGDQPVPAVRDYDATVSGDVPSAWWKLADPPGSAAAADSSAGAHPGTPASVTFGAAGPLALAPAETAASFDGAASRVDTAYNPSGVTAVTVEAWINLAGAAQSGNPRILANSHTDTDNRGYQLMLTAGRPQAWFGNGTVTGNAAAALPVPAAGWTHLAAAWDGTTIRLYVNAALAGTGTLTGTLAAGTANTGIGYNPAYSGDWYAGTAGQCAVWAGTALTAAQVLAHYQAGQNELPYEDLTRPDDDTMLANDIQATIAGSSNMQQAKDAASIAKYLFPRSYPATGLILQNDADALNWATYVLSISKGDESRFDQVTLSGDTDPVNLYPHLLGRDIGDRIRVWRRPPGMAPISKDCFIRSITHTITIDRWETVWGLQNAARYSFLTLDHPVLGRLDANAVNF